MPVEFIGQIQIEGNATIQDRVIIGQLDFTTGDPFDLKKVEKAEADLLRLDIFDRKDPPTVRFGETDPTTGLRNIIVRGEGDAIGHL